MNAAAISTALFDKNHLISIKAEGTGCELLFADGRKVREEKKMPAVLDSICLAHGSSLAGRQASFCFLVGHVYKPCILLDERSEAMMLVVNAIDREDGMVVSFNDIAAVRREENGSRLIMKNRMILHADASVRTMRKQMQRCELFLRKLDSRNGADML